MAGRWRGVVLEGLTVRAVDSRPWLRELALGLLVTVALAYSTMFTAITAPNERSRIYLAVSLVDHGTIEITQAIQRFGPILDEAEHGGKYYSDKAPGSSLLVALVYGPLRLFTSAEAWTIDELLLLTRRGLMVPLGVAGFFALRLLMRRIGITQTIADVVSLGWILGSAAFHYSTALYGHQIVGVSLVLSLLCLIEAEARLGQSWPLVTALSLGAGASAGLAGLTEYQSGIPALFLALYAAFGPLGRSIYGLAAFVAGALPFLVALGVYNTIAFGGPLELSYHHLINSGLESIHSQGIGGVTLPSSESFRGGILSLHRGLLPTSPMFVFVLPGVWAMFRRGYTRLGVLLGATTLFFLLFISSSNMWFAGWSFGPRLLVPGMGLMALLVAAGAQHFARYAVVEPILRGTVIAGVVCHQLVHAFFPEPPHDAKNPLLDVVAVLFRANLVAPNLFTASGWAHGLWSLLVLAAVVSAILLFVLFTPLRVRRLWVRAAIVAASLCLVALLFVAVRLAGPTGTPENQAGMVRFVSDLLAQEPARL